LRKLLVRSITGLIYIALTIVSIYAGKYAFACFFGIILAYSLFEFYRLCKNGGYKPYYILGIATTLFMFVAVFLYENQIVSQLIFFGLIPLVMLMPVLALLQKDSKPVVNIAFTILGIVYVGIPFSIFNFIITPLDHTPLTRLPHILLILFVILWVADSGAYIIGSTLGRRKMIESVSPLKTWEGAIGGLVLAIAASLIMFHFFHPIGTFHAIAISILTVIAGTFGDLTESLIKRSFDVKDTGNLLPGHGGLLDRFDSMLFAAPIFYIYISLILNS
jgi:phosphatidate cytidylyltransferase